jgi:drug/metabolite transporter (DMT)-like permease
VAVQGWAYLGASAWMSLAAAMAVPRQALVLSPASFGVLLYWVLVVSIFCYCVLTSATRVLAATHVAAFICVQPLAGAVLAWALFNEPQTPWDLGAVPIVLGLFLVTGSAGNVAADAGPSTAKPSRV